MFLACVCVLPLSAAASTTAPAAGASTGLDMTHRMMLLVIQVGVILFAAKIGNILFGKLRLPGALGELLAGILIGPYLLGKIPLYGFANGLFPRSGGMAISPELFGLCAVAAVVLLFVTGLETDIALLLRYSWAGGVVGLGGVVASFCVGAAAMMLGSSWLLGRPVGFLAPESMFLGIILSATSVGITARVLSERRKLDSPEGVTILSAAVIDDVIGIVLLAVVLGVTSASRRTGGVDWGRIGLIGAKAVGVWLAATAIGLLASRRISFVLKLFGRRTSVAVMALGLALVLGGLFEQAGLAMIIGAYVMGLSLSRSDLRHMVRDKLAGVYELLVPVFFCVMGMRIDVAAVGSPEVLGFGAAYAGLALLSKLVGCGLPALAANFTLRGALRIGFGMAPRCEVALIIAGIGLSAGVLDGRLFAAVVLMVLVNSIVAPAGLALLYRSAARGTRKVPSTRAQGKRKVLFEFPSRATTEFLVGKLTEVFEAEGFFVHPVSHTPRLWQLRKDAAVIDLRCDGTQLLFDCREADVPLINTAMYEAVAELERAIRGLKQPLDSGTIATRLQDYAAPGFGLLDLKSYLTPALVEPALAGRTKAEVIDELLDLLARHGRIGDVAACRKAVWTREESLSTGLQHGVAIPHGRTDAVQRLVCAVGIKPDGVDFDAMDGEPSRIFILTLSPENRPAPHVQFMSTVSQVLNDAGRRRLLVCKTARELYEAFTARPVPEAGPPRPRFRLADYLSPAVVAPALRGRSKEQIIDELLALLERDGRLANVDAAREAILQRERQMSTGMTDGLAIPHGRSDTVERLTCAVGIQHDGTDFGSLDGKPTRIFVLALTPVGGSDPYLQFAAAIAGQLDEAGRQRVLAARTAEELYSVLTDGGRR